MKAGIYLHPDQARAAWIRRAARARGMSEAEYMDLLLAAAGLAVDERIRRDVELAAQVLTKKAAR